MVHDCLIVGGGPAGLSAAIYMARFKRDVVVIDDGKGRSTTDQLNENYLGFPKGIAATELRRLGREQAERFGATFIQGEVERIERCRQTGDPTQSQSGPLSDPSERSEKDFIAHTSRGAHIGRSVILCTGVTDIWPEFPDLWDRVGRDLFWCITCDGFRCIDIEIVLYGADEDAAASVCQFANYTSKIRFIVPAGGLDCPEERLDSIRALDVEVIEGVPAAIEGPIGKMHGVLLEDGRKVPGEVMFSLLGSKPNNELALQIGLECSPKGYVKVDAEGYTSVPGVFAAGDLSRMHSHQVVSAAHEGAEAAQTANNYLYSDSQRLHKDDPVEKPEQLAGDRPV